MIRKKEELEVATRVNMKGGEGQVVQTKFATQEEMLNHVRVFARLHLDPHCGIGHHIHEDENELFLVEDGEAIYEDNGKEVSVKKGDICICNPGSGHSVHTEDKACDLIALVILK